MLCLCERKRGWNVEKEEENRKGGRKGEGGRGGREGGRKRGRGENKEKKGDEKRIFRVILLFAA